MTGRVMWAAGLAMVLAVQPTLGQDLRGRDQRGDELHRLQDEIAKLKGQLQDVEARIKEAEMPARRGPGPAFGGGFGGRGGFGAGMRPGHGFGGFGGAPFQRHVGLRGFGGMGGPPFGRNSASMKNVEDKLDRVIQELERLRSEMRRR